MDEELSLEDIGRPDEEQRPKGKFDLAQNSNDNELSLEDIGQTDYTAQSGGGWIDSIKEGAKDLGQSIVGGIMHPEQTWKDFHAGIEHGNIGRVPVNKALSAAEASIPDEKGEFLDRLNESFERRQKEDEAKYLEAQERSPFASRYGEFLGSVASLGSLPTKITKYTKPLAGAIDRIITAGATNYGLKNLTSEKPVDQKEAAKEAAWSLGIQTAAEAVPYIPSAVKYMGKKALSAFSTLPEENLSRYYHAPDAVNNARNIDEIKTDVDLAAGAEAAKYDAAKSAKDKADEALDLSYRKKVDDLKKSAVPLDYTDNLLTKIDEQKAVLGEKSSRAYDELEKINDTFNTGYLKGEISKLADSLRVGTRKVDGKLVKGAIVGETNQAAYQKLQNLRKTLDELPDTITMAEAKDLLKSIDPDISWKRNAGEFNETYDKLMKAFRRNLNERLRKKSPEFGRLMDEISDLSTSLSEVSEKFGTRERSNAALNRIISGKDRISEDVLNRFGQKTGNDFLGEISGFKTNKDLLEKSRFEDLKPLLSPDELKAAQLANERFNQAESLYGDVKRITPQTSQGKLKNVGGRNPKIEDEKALAELGVRHGQDFVRETKDRAIKEGFNQSTSGGRGHRFALAGAVYGAMSSLAHDAGLLSAIKGTGALAGGGLVLDAYAPKITQVAIDGARFASKITDPAFKKFSSIIERAFEHGPAAAAAVHLMFMDKIPEYRDAIQGREAQREALKKLSR